MVQLAICIGVVALAAILFYLSRHPGTISSPWMHVVSLDEDGNQIGKGKWVRIPAPDRVDRNGLNHIVKYVARLVKSTSTRCSLIIGSLDDTLACLIVRREGQLHLLESIHLAPSSRVVKKPFKRFPYLPPHTPEPEKEQAIRHLFAELNIAPDTDSVHDYNGHADAMRDLHYPIGNDVGQATQIIQRLLREVYHVQETEGLNFTFEEDE